MTAEWQIYCDTCKPTEGAVVYPNIGDAIGNPMIGRYSKGWFQLDNYAKGWTDIFQFEDGDLFIELPGVEE